MLIRMILIAALSVMLPACVSATYDPETGKVHYLRVGSTKMDGLTVNTSAGTSIELAGYGSEGTDLVEAAARGAVQGVRP